eukprot:CAMPEP_0185038920 /NCGR_PEP_ID=MMETSP1103-20130426/35177_1 /TAXON_ID=36769 /ORGANISM="Paraphysomonas bandaiensis, Strain Caron Lab Isolate" /LENGTH=389 /DNA_ID=CAMNT_0027577583 /DNA_START=120 /DNA_END=1289 /DNA_ORIENTATION=+
MPVLGRQRSMELLTRDPPTLKKLKSTDISTSSDSLPTLKPVLQRQQTDLSKVKNKFSEGQLLQYRQWFDSMDTDGSGGVGIDELTNTLLSSGIVKFKKDVERIFKEMDADNNGEVSFDEFVYAIAVNDAKRRLQLQKLDSLVNSDKVLSTETLLSVERRNVLMQHIVDKTADRMSYEYQGSPAGRDKIKHHKKVLRLEQTHAKERADTNAMVYYLEQVVKQVKDDRQVPSRNHQRQAIPTISSFHSAKSLPSFPDSTYMSQMMGVEQVSGTDDVIGRRALFSHAKSRVLEDRNSVATPLSPLAPVDREETPAAATPLSSLVHTDRVEVPIVPQQLPQSLDSNKIILRKIGSVSGDAKPRLKLGRLPSSHSLASSKPHMNSKCIERLASL